MDRGKVGKSPVFIFTALYLAGILVGSRYYIAPIVLVALTAISVTFSIIFIFKYFKKRTFISEAVVPLLLIFSIIFIGWINIDSSEYIRLNSSNSKLLQYGQLYTDCKIIGAIVEKPKSYQIEVYVPDFDENSVLYVDKKIKRNDIQTGDTLHCLLKPRKIENYTNSGFNYALYMEKRGYYSSSYVKSNDIQIKKLRKPSIRDKINLLRERYVHKIISSGGSSDESATLIALTIGEKSLLSRDTKNAYSNSGTMHLLAVSGLHVGFIYTFLSIILSFLGNTRFSMVLRMVVISATLWIYTAIVGFSPSITRAAIMATIYEMCKILERNGSGLNALSISALLITLFRPQSLFELGFQLSFISILSIILIYPRINAALVTKSKVIGYIWTTLSMSVACQIGTSMITICTFNYFPTYFLITNLIAVPLSALILYFGLFQVFTLGSRLISEYVMDIILYLVKFLNWFVARADTMPYSVIQCSLNNCQIISLVTLIILFSFNILPDENRKVYIYIGLIICLFMGSF